jgi:hypothetical protein
MARSYRYIVFAFLQSLVNTLCYSQNWTRKPVKETTDSLLGVYSWNEQGEHQDAAGEIRLFKNRQFHYSAFYPLSVRECSRLVYAGLAEEPAPAVFWSAAGVGWAVSDQLQQ